MAAYTRRFRLALLAGIAVLPFVTGEAHAETICSQAVDGTVECTEGATVVATGTLTPGAVVPGPGLSAAGTDVVGTMSGDITTAGDGVNAITLRAFLDVSFDYAGTLVTQGADAVGIGASSTDEFLQIRVGDVFTSGAGSPGIAANGFEVASVGCSSVTTTGVNSLGVFAGSATFSGAASVSCGNVSATGAGSRGIVVSGTGGASASAGDVTSDAAGVTVSGGLFGSGVRVGRVTTTGNDADGISLDATGEAGVECESVTTHGDRSIGLHLSANGDDPLSVTCGDVRTEGVASSGVQVTAANEAMIAVGNVITSGTSALGISVSAGGLDAFDERFGNLDLTCGNVTTTGDGADAVRLSSHEVTALCGDVTAIGAGSRGVSIDGDNSDTTWGNIVSDGIALSTGGRATVGDVTTFGDGGAGIRLSNENGGASVDCHSVTTFGDNADGISSFAYQGGNGVTCGNIRTEGDHSFGAGLTETGFQLGNVTTLGFGSVGVWASGFFATSGRVGDIFTSGDQAMGIRMDSEELDLIAANIRTEGDDSSAAVFSVYLRGEFNLALGDIVTLGARSAGISLTGEGGGTLSAGNINTSGIGSGGILASVTEGGLDFSVGNVSTVGGNSAGIQLTTGTATASDSDIVLVAGDVWSAGDNSPAVVVDSSGGAMVTVGNVSTAGVASPGVQVHAGGADPFDSTTANASLMCGDVTTTGANSNAVSVGASDFFASVDVTCGDIRATGAGSAGLSAGAGGNVHVAVGDVTSSGVGISAGTSEGSFSLTAGNVTTLGPNAVGINISVSDGGGSLTCGDVTTLGANSAGIRTFASDGRLSVSCGNVRTEGDGSTGVSHGTDGFLSLATVTTLGDHADGVILSSDFGSVGSIGAISTSGEQSRGIVVFSDFANFSAGDVTTTGDNSTAVVVTPFFGGDIALEFGKITATGANSHGVDVNMGSGAVSLTLGGVAVIGAGADAIRIDSGQDTVTDLQIALNTSGDITSADGTAISVETLSDFAFSLGEGLEVSGRTGGILVDAASTNLDIAGSVRASEGPAIRALGGPATVNAGTTGSVSGFMVFGAGADVVSNAGLITTLGNSDFGAGIDLFNNSNRLVVSGQAVFNHLERFENNGTIDMQDGVPDDRLTIAGDYVAGTGATVLLDVSRSLDSADVLAIGGDVSGNTLLSIDWVDSNAPVHAGGVLLVEGAASPDDFTIEGLEDFGLFALTLRERDGNLYLMATIDPAATDLALLGFVGSDAWYQSFDGLRASIAGRGSFLPKLGFWAQAYGGRDRSGGRGIADLFGVDVPASTRLETERLGAQLGFDGSVGGMLVGVTGGYEKSNSDAGLSSHVDVRGFNVGAYASIGASVGPYATAAIKLDRLDVESKNPALDIPKLDATSSGADLELGWRSSLALVSLDVNAGLSFVRSTIDDFTIDGTRFEAGNDTWLRGRLGGRVVLRGPLRPFAEARLFHEFGNGNALRIVSGTLDADVSGVKRGTWARLEAGIGGGSSRALVSAWADVGNRKGFGLRAGVRF